MRRSVFPVPFYLAAIGFSVFTASGLGVRVEAQERPLGERIEEDKGKLSGEKSQLRRDEKKEEQDQQNAQQYVQASEQWIQQADTQAAEKQAQLNALEAGKPKAILNKLLNTPGNQYYVLRTWLASENAQKAQAESNIQRAELSAQRDDAAVRQDRYQITADSASLHSDQGSYRDEMDSHNDLVRSMKNAQYVGDRSLMHRGRYYTQVDQASYDAGRHAVGLGNPYWRNRNAGGFGSE